MVAPPRGSAARQVLLRYGFAVFGTGAAVLLLHALQPLVHPIVATPLLAAVAASAMLGGMGPGLISAGLALAALNYWLFPPALSSPNAVIRQIVFVLSAVVVSVAGGMARRGRRRAEQETRDSEHLRHATELAASQAEEAAAAVRLANERLELARSTATFELWDWDMVAGTYRYSPGYFALYGLPPDAPPPSYEYWRDRLLHPDDRDRVAREVETALAGAHPYDVEFRVVWPDGTIRWLAGRGQVLRDPSGRPTRMMGVNFDVTSRRMAEERLQQVDRLETIGRLAGGVAHEANNQMTVVLGAADFILRNENLPDEVRADAATIVRAGEHTATITEQLLAFGRRQVLRVELLDVNRVIAELLPLLSRTLGDDAVVQLDLAPDTARVRGDRGKLEQVLLELGLNARDAMPRGGVFKIVARNDTLDEAFGTARGVRVRPGAYVALLVSDTGYGIESRALAHVFEPFFTTKSVGQGTGLGLATVYGIVKQTDGYVFVESEPGHGTTISIYLPAVRDSRQASPDDAHVEAGVGDGAGPTPPP